MRFSLKNTLVYAVGIAFVGTIIFYAYFQSRGVLAGPQIAVREPTNGTTTRTALITISGVATNAKELTLDGRPIFVDLSGNFYEQLLLMNGYNIIELTAKDGEGRELKKGIEVVYDPPYTGVVI